MSKTPRVPLEHDMRGLAEVLQGPPPPGAKTLLGAVASVFPKTASDSLEEWLSEVPKKAGAEQERLLFLILLCGTQFWINRPEVRAVQGELYGWLRGLNRNMDPGLADLLIEALTPRLSAVLARRGGWRLGPKGAFVPRTGAPPRARGAWTAGLLVEFLLGRVGAAKTSAKELALTLVAVLLGRDVVEESEYSRARTALKRSQLGPLLSEIDRQYEYWVIHDGARQGKDPPARELKMAYSAWRRKHEAMSFLLEEFGSEGLCLRVLDRMPPEVWAPFLVFESGGSKLHRTRALG